MHRPQPDVGSAADDCNLDAAGLRCAARLLLLLKRHRLDLHPDAPVHGPDAAVDALNRRRQIKGDGRSPALLAAMTAMTAKETEGPDVVAVRGRRLWWQGGT